MAKKERTPAQKAATARMLAAKGGRHISHSGAHQVMRTVRAEDGESFLKRAKPKKSKTEAQQDRQKHRDSTIGMLEGHFDKQRSMVRSVTILSVAVGAVKLNQRYPDGFTPLKLEASTVGVLGTGLAFFLARRFGWRRTSSTLVDVGIGMVSGTLSSNVGSGKTPMLAQKSA